MASTRANPRRSRLADLWQLPLLIISLALFAYAAYKFIDPKPGPSVVEKIELAQDLMAHERADTAIDVLNKILDKDTLDQPQEARVHLLIASAIEQYQKQRKENFRSNHIRIIEQSKLAMALGQKPTSDLYRRMAESYDAIERTADALEAYRRAIGLDESRSQSLARKVIDLQLQSKDYGAAQASLNEYLRRTDISNVERAWALGMNAQLLIDKEQYLEARGLLAQVSKMDNSPMTQGVVMYRLGYCEWKLGDNAEAERKLRVARDLFKIQHPLDADAAVTLGRILEDRQEFQQAQSFYQDVLVSHPDAKIATLARIGRGMCRIEAGKDDQGLTDLHDVVNEIVARESRDKYRPAAIDALRHAGRTLINRGNYQGALELIGYEQTLLPEPPAGFFARLGEIYEKRSDQLEQTILDASPIDKIKLDKQARDLRTKAGDSYVAYSRALTLTDDKAYGDALWRGIELYDKAANLQSVISSLELFVAERPSDQNAPNALYRLGRSYQAAGMIDKAIAAFQRNQFRYPQSLAASKSAVPLAQAYIAKGPESYPKAESVLLSVVDNNPLVTPAAEEFKNALLELANLYYRTERYEAAIARFEGIVERYPTDDRMGQLLYMMGDSYRKSAQKLAVRVANVDTPATPAVIDLEAHQARRERLARARTLYDKVVDTYRAALPRTDVDRLYNKLAHFYRADCLYDLGQYEEAIKSYDQAAFRYQEDPSALAAYVQIVNAYCALGKTDEAKTANERAKWLLKRMPPEAFTDGTFAMPKAYWEQWLKWTSDSGMW